MIKYCEQITPDVIEYQVDNMCRIEKSYRSYDKKSIPHVMRLIQSLVSVNVEDIELVGFHIKDRISYTHDCSTFTICGRCPLYASNDLLDFYAIKLHNEGVYYKLYKKYNIQELEFVKTIIHNFPTSWPALEFGVGFYPDKYNIFDYYFYTLSSNVEMIYQYFDMSMPPIPQNTTASQIAHFGITVVDNKVIKLKRYFHGLDPALQRWTMINGARSTYEIYKNTEYFKYLKYDISFNNHLSNVDIIGFNHGLSRKDKFC
jgi:hypothetical protein|nr:MAG TPA: hypothetical protein [Caudoviricetes sp.]